jgi:multiple sugar transport system substrate-binding protein
VSTGGSTRRLRGITWDHPRGRDPLVALGPASGPDGQLKVVWSARSLQAFADFPLERLVDEYDLLVIDHPHIPLVAREGLLAPLDLAERGDELALLASQSIGGSHESYQHAGHQWALAIDAAAQVSVHRPDLIAQPPATWDEVLELAGDGRVRLPLKPVDAMSSFLTLVAQGGSPACAVQGRFVERDEALAALELLHRLVELIGGSCLTDNPIDVAEALSRSDEWCYAPLAFGYVNYSRAGFRPARLAYRDVPVGRRGVAGSCLGGAGIAVSARSGELDAAIDCAFWLASSSVQRDSYYWAGGQPANAVAWEDEAINADSLDFFRGTRGTLDAAQTRPRHAGWMAMQERVGELVHAALRSELDDEACVAALDSEAERLLSSMAGS